MTRTRIAMLRAENDRGLLSMVMIVVIVGLGIGALLVPMIVQQSHSTSHSDTRVQALHAAEAGINVMIGRLRSVVTSDGVTGIASSLPCTDPAHSASTLTGNLASLSTISYTVTVQYFASDPLKASPPAISCPIGTGIVPLFARIASTGTDSARGSSSTRTLTTTYVFATTDTTPSATTSSTASPMTSPDTNGGQIQLNPLTVTNVRLCMDAGVNPAAGTSISMKLCDSTNNAQLFFYSTDLSVRLLYSTTVAAPYGLCLDSVVPHVIGNAVTMQACSSPGNSTYNQQWSVNEAGAFVATKSDLTHDSTCLAVPDPGLSPAPANLQLPVVSGAMVQVNKCPTSYNPIASWLPTLSFGNGAAGPANGQLVNFSQYDRCAKVTQPVSTSVILYPCQQETKPANVAWSQKFNYSLTTRQWVTSTGTTSYCLTSAGIALAPVTETACDTNNNLQKWTQFGVTLADQVNASQYNNPYTTVDNNGFCLSLSTGANWFVDPTTSVQYTKLTSDTCDGTTQQKWNATPNVSSLQNTGEK